MLKSKLLQKTLSNTKIYLAENGPTILTCIGAAGVIATSVSAIKSAKKYESIVLNTTYEEDRTLSKREKAKIAIESYAPTIFIGLTTISCIFGSNALNKQKQAAITSAYMLLDTSYKEYRNKVKELYGDETDERVMSEIIKDGVISDEVLMYGEKKLFYEPVSRRYFEATVTKVQQAEYMVNRELAMLDYVNLNTFFRYLGLEQTDTGEVLGWSTFSGYQKYNYSWIDFKHIPTELEDGLECYAITYPQEPRMDFMDF